LLSESRIQSFDIHQKKLVEFNNYMQPSNGSLSVIVTSGASCPDAIVDNVIQRLISFVNPTVTIEEAFTQFVARLSEQE
jgi:4-hydroxy-3-methylbut-2-enyl diphosphate reductase